MARATISFVILAIACLWIVAFAPFAAMTTGCGPGADMSCPSIRSGNGTEYPYNETRTTNEGISVDTSGHEVDLKAIDCIVSALEACMAATPENAPGHIEQIERSCVRIKIAPDWFYHPCSNGKVQVFGCDVDPVKTCGIDLDDPDTGCPCTCGGLVQDEQIVVVTPSLSFLAHELIHIFGNVYDPIPEEMSYCERIKMSNCENHNPTPPPQTGVYPLTLSRENTCPFTYPQTTFPR